MNCYYYAVYKRSTKKIVYANFSWAEKFQEIIKTEASQTFGCIEISKKIFNKIRTEEITLITQI